MNQPTQRTEEPVAVVLDLFHAVLHGDVDGVRRHVTDDVVLRVPGTHPLAGDHVGAGALVAFVERSRALTDDGEHIDVLDVLAGREHVALYCNVTATRSGREPLQNRTVHVARLTDGRVAEIALHNRDDRPVDAFWS
jgi:ketosteroid isomerase-like protein